MAGYVAIIDYDAGNLKSVEKALDFIGMNAVITRDRDEIYRASHVILPGVGAFGDAMGLLDKFSLIEPINEVTSKGTPFLGICLGLQLLYEDSEETPGVRGLGILKGHILKIPKKDGLKIPHIGWNSIKINGGRLFKDIDDKNEPYVYFVHSYYLDALNKDEVKANAFYSVDIDASVEKGNVFACQFHPEKSGDTGLQILKNFMDV
jgi:imidazole glycerol-phosphate synthase subunit HisH